MIVLYKSFTISMLSSVNQNKSRKMKYLTFSVAFCIPFFLVEIQSFVIQELEPAETPLQTEFKKGGGKEYQEAQHSAQGEKGSKGYAEKHEEESGKKGYHDREGEKKHYAEAGGNKQSHKHEDGHYADQHKTAKGQRGYHYADSGKYAKGHDTKGHHQIHKLNEYQKKTEFFDENSDKAFKENHGGYEENKGISSGKNEKGGLASSEHQAKKFEKNGKFDKGHQHADESGFKNAHGNDQFHKNLEEFEGGFEADGFKSFGQSYQRR